MQINFQHGPTRYSLLAIPIGRHEVERRAANIQPDPNLWANPSEKLRAINHRMDYTPSSHERDRHYRKNATERREKTRLRMRALRARRKAA